MLVASGARKQLLYGKKFTTQQQWRPAISLQRQTSETQEHYSPQPAELHNSRKRAAWSKCCSTVFYSRCWRARVPAAWEQDKCSIALTPTKSIFRLKQSRRAVASW